MHGVTEAEFDALDRHWLALAQPDPDHEDAEPPVVRRLCRRQGLSRKEVADRLGHPDRVARWDSAPWLLSIRRRAPRPAELPSWLRYAPAGPGHLWLAVLLGHADPGLQRAWDLDSLDPALRGDAQDQVVQQALAALRKARTSGDDP